MSRPFATNLDQYDQVRPQARCRLGAARPVVSYGGGRVPGMTGDEQERRQADEDWDRFVDGQLAELGLSRDELAQQAAQGEFGSPSAQHLWTLIG